MPVQNLGTCDFCLAPIPGDWWEHPAKPFVAKTPDGQVLHRSDGPWGACRTCTDLIDAGRTEDLVRRAVDNLIARLPPSPLGRDSALRRFSAEAAARLVHTAFLQHRTGPPTYHASWRPRN